MPQHAIEIAEFVLTDWVLAWAAGMIGGSTCTQLFKYISQEHRSRPRNSTIILFAMTTSGAIAPAFYWLVFDMTGKPLIGLAFATTILCPGAWKLFEIVVRMKSPEASRLMRLDRRKVNTGPADDELRRLKVKVYDEEGETTLMSKTLITTKDWLMR